MRTNPLGVNNAFRSITCVLGLVLAPPAFALGNTGDIGDAMADRVLGQAQFDTNAENFVDASGLFGPRSVAIDRSAMPNRVYIADARNNRVLAWRNADGWANGDPADVVIGQPNFNSHICNNGGISASSLCLPDNVLVDPAGNLYVTDAANDRVLRYDSPLSTDQVADRVFGQPDFVSRTCNGDATLASVSASTLCGPDALAMDSAGNLYVSDTSNQRVLRYNMPGTGDAVADLVLGQPDFTSNGCNNGVNPPLANGLCAPLGLAVNAAGDLFVADSSNHRVVRFSAPLSNHAMADLVLGQPDFATTTPNTGGLSASSLSSPFGVALDSAENLYVFDLSNARVLGFDLPLATHQDADRVLGQAGFSTSGCNAAGLSAASLCGPHTGAFDAGGNLYVVDSFNQRVIVFPTPLNSGVAATRVLGQGAFDRRGENRIDGRGIGDARGVAVDQSTSPNRLYLTDRGNQRVVAWRDIAAWANGDPADLVIGQPDLFSVECNQGGAPSASTVCKPGGVAVDAAGNLYLTDIDNHRVLIYLSPFDTDTVADHVLGQGSFTTGLVDGGGAPSASGFNSPLDLTVDPNGNLYVSDFVNHRVLGFTSPLTTDAMADIVLGQANFGEAECNRAGAVSASSLCSPIGVSVDTAGNLYVADFLNNRVLQFDQPLSNDNIADRVLGQADFVSADASGASASSLGSPVGVDVDALGNVFVSDFFNSRVLQYDTPMRSDAVADRVFGQPDFTTVGCNQSGVNANSLCFPYGMDSDADGNLYQTDINNSRLLAYHQPLAADYGDAPDSFATLFASDGPRHRVSTLQLGLALDLELDGLPGAAAQGDDANANPDDEDGVSVVPLAVGQNNSVDIVSSAVGKLSVWIDSNRDGGFADPAERVLHDFDTTAGAQTLNLIIPANASFGPSFARFRLSSAGGLGPTGLAADGEVEDHAVVLGVAPTVTAPANQMLAEDGQLTVAFQVNDRDENEPVSGASGGGGGFGMGEKSLADLSLMVASSNTALLPLSGISLGGNGGARTISMQPAANQNGVVTITLTATDPQGNTGTGNFQLTVSPVNDAPVATAQALATPHNTTLNGQLVATDVDGDELSFVKASDPANGSLTINANGSFNYTPFSGFAGEDQFGFRADDNQAPDLKLASEPATVTITVGAAPATPGGGGGGFSPQVPTQPLPSPTPSVSPTPTPDADGVDAATEDQIGDGNGDGIPDSQQNSVASLFLTLGFNEDGSPRRTSLTLSLPARPGATTTAALRMVQVRPRADIVPAAVVPPSGFVLPAELLSFDIEGLAAGETVEVEIALGAVGDVPAFDSYFKFGPLLPGRDAEYYEFLFDGQTGARFRPETRTINGQSRELLIITLNLIDGQRGDGDLSANGRISDPGAPALIAASPGVSPAPSPTPGPTAVPTGEPSPSLAPSPSPTVLPTMTVRTNLGSGSLGWMVLLPLMLLLTSPRQRQGRAAATCRNR